MPTFFTFAVVLSVSLVSCLILVGGLLALMKITNSDRQLQGSILEYQQLNEQQKSLNDSNANLELVGNKLMRMNGTQPGKLRNTAKSTILRKEIPIKQRQGHQQTGLLHRIKQVKSHKQMADMDAY